MTQPTDTRRASLLDAALRAAERDWPILPLLPGGKRPAGHAEEHCPHTGRCATGHRTPEQRATTDIQLIRTAWSQRPYNVAIATGPAGLLVVDLDTLKLKDAKGTPDGVTAFLALCERAGQAVPTTYRVRTPSGGAHLYFTAPPGTRLKSSAGRLSKKIDTRGWGGYVVAPGSTTRQGAYEVTDPAPVAELPAWLTVRLQPPAPTTAPVIVFPRDASRCAQVALERECAVVTAAKTEGQRNDTLYRSACKVGRFVAWGDIARHEVEAAFQGAGESTGLPPAECRTTIRSALDWSARTARPREAV
ncbi:bifunctional DNA primase/polymerase [Streptomyces sp. NBC_00038]|uniref:bifunctional DNA primase/polymerase n=1 Tax=Streptomyces sp. NBC_00038 TaxID=2903615 RepID=UPI0022534C8E|nr:bifunctional DNA primase/polymerase [Streptomyces sp. NBC_00038]MCX5559937.1 bifunctional DNA primase/polymerase [Streptomyces sp. NBC_00038]